MRRELLIGYLILALIVCGAWRQSGVPIMGSTQAPSGSFAAPVFSAVGTPCMAAPNCTASVTASTGQLILVPIATPPQATFTSFSVAGSNSDAFQCGTINQDVGGNRAAVICWDVATSSITSATLTSVGYTSGDFLVNPIVYSNPAAKTTATILDKATAGASTSCLGVTQGNENTTAFTACATATLGNATDLCLSFFWTNTGTWSAGTGTQRGSGVILPTVSFAQDQTTSTTAAVTPHVTLSVSGFGPGVGACFL